MNATVVRLTARSLLGRRRALLLALLPAVLLLMSTAVRGLVGPEPEVAVLVLGTFALGTLLPLLGVIAGTGSIGPEIDDGSIVYLLSKPLSRHVIVLSKLVVAVGVVLVLGALPTLLSGLVLVGTEDGIAVAYGAASAVAGTAYCALFVLLGVVTRNAVVVGLLYALVWESLVGQLVPGAQALSVQQWSLWLAERLLGTAAQDLGVSSAVGAVAVPLLLALTVGCAWAAGHQLRSLRLTSEA